MKLRSRVAIATISLLALSGLSMAAQPIVASAADSTEAAKVPKSCPKHPEVGKICEHTRVLLVRYSVKTECKIQDNYPINPGATPKTWTIEPGSEIIWRYNVNGHVALISDPNKPGFPHWGFVTNRDCIGTTVQQQGTYWRFEKPKNAKARWVKHKTPTVPAGQPVPTLIRAGRSQKAESGYWNTVDWKPAKSGTSLEARTLGHDRTLRDQPEEFVIGNVKADWQIRPTNEHKRGYTKVYVPSLDRWGWLEL